MEKKLSVKEVNLKEKDRKLIKELAKSFDYFVISNNICRKEQYKIKIESTIDDLNEEELRKLLPKIDLYIGEESERINKITMDEAWLFKYIGLKRAIEEKLDNSQILKIDAAADPGQK